MARHVHSMAALPAEPESLSLMRLLQDSAASNFQLHVVFGMAFLIVVSLVSAVVGVIAPSLVPTKAIRTAIAGIILTVVVATVLFAGAFRFLPEVEMQWRDVWSRAIIATLMFVTGRYLIGPYVATADVSSPVGTGLLV